MTNVCTEIFPVPEAVAPLIPVGIFAVHANVIAPGNDELNVTKLVVVLLQMVWLVKSNITFGFGYTSIVIVKGVPVHVPAVGETVYIIV